MAQSALKKKLSASTDGMAIKVAATSSAGTLIHTAVAGTVATTFDEIWLWVFNSSAADVVLTIEWGGATAPDQNQVITVPPKGGPLLVIPGWILQNGATVKAFAASANVITITGYIHAIS